MKSFISMILFLMVLIAFPVHSFEILYPKEKGFFIGAELPYQAINSKLEKQNGIFIFGQKKIQLEGKEYFDCVFFTTTSTYHFYFTLDPNKQTLLFKGLEIGTSQISTDQPVISVSYPLFSGKKWSEEKIEMVGKNITIPDLGVLPSLTVKNVKAISSVVSDNFAVPAGKFETLRVETNFSGDILNIPVTIVQRTWLDRRNIIIKMSFEFQFFSKITPIFDMELLELVPAGCFPRSKLVSCWASLKKEVGR